MAVTEARPWRLDEFTWVVDRPGKGGTFATCEVAGVGSRFLGGLVDALLLAVLLTAAAAALWWMRPEEAAGGMEWIRASAWNTATVPPVLAVLHILFSLLFELAARGRTPGKMICRLRVVAVSGADARAGQVVLRNILRLADWLPFYYVLGAVLATVTDYRQRLGDLAARTLVIHDVPLRDLLARSATPASAYSTSEDGYLLEAALNREMHLSPEASATLESRLAVYLHRTYLPDDPLLRDLYAQGNYPAYLRALYRHERATESYGEVPSGLPEAPPPVEE